MIRLNMRLHGQLMAQIEGLLRFLRTRRLTPEEVLEIKREIAKLMKEAEAVFPIK